MISFIHSCSPTFSILLGRLAFLPILFRYVLKVYRVVTTSSDKIFLGMVRIVLNSALIHRVLACEYRHISGCYFSPLKK